MQNSGPAPQPSLTPEWRGKVSCPHFGPCGGCDFLDRTYDDEIERKSSALRSLFEAEAALAGAPIRPLRAAEQPLFWRTSIKVPFGMAGRRRVAGIYSPGSHRIVDLETCSIHHPPLTRILLAAKKMATEFQVPIYHEAFHKGVLRYLVARAGMGTGQILVGLVVRDKGARQVKAMGWKLFERFRDEGLVGVVENYNPQITNRILGPRSQRICGRELIREEWDGLSVLTSLNSFSQANVAQAAVLYRTVFEFLGEVRGRQILDVYSGSGPIALRLAKAGAHVTAIERNPSAVREGRAAARYNGLSLRFLEEDAAGAVEALAVQADAMVLDPPRAGLEADLVAALNATRVERVVYVSCNPQTLVRDLVLLAPAYAIEAVQPVDLFPRTEHLETVVSLVPRAAPTNGEPVGA